MSRNFFINGECAIFRTLPKSPEVYIESRTFNVQKALDRCEILNRGADYEHFVVRVSYYDKFYKLNKNGTRGDISLQQMWTIEPSYLDRHYDKSNWSSILNCTKCSYPFFAFQTANADDGLSPERAAQVNSDDYAVSQPETCLVGDSGRAIDCCPGCGSKLFWGDFSQDNYAEDEEVTFPSSLEENEGYEYVVVQTHPLIFPLRFILRTFNYNQAHDIMQMENQSEDNKCFVIRIIDEDGELYQINSQGEKWQSALEQNWEIDGDYLAISQRDTNHSAILRCQCGYPYFTTVALEYHIRGLYPATPPVSCLVDDSDREFTECTNCDTVLFEAEPMSERDYIKYRNPIPEPCLGCVNYFGKIINGTRLICAMHPHGWNGDKCPDYTA